VSEHEARYQQTLARAFHDHPLIGMAFRHRSMRRTPISFRDRPYLVELYVVLDIDYEPLCDGLDIVKAPQTGQSEQAIQLVFYEAGWLGRFVGYVLPVDRLRDRFVSARINPLLLDVPQYRKKLPGNDLAELRDASRSKRGEAGNLRIKKLGNGAILFLGAKTDADFVELSVDTMVIDEYDLCINASKLNVAKAADRLREANRPHLHRMGNAEIPRGGITKLFEEGDQRLYHWRCSHCGERQPIDWLENVVRQDDSGKWIFRDPLANKHQDGPVRVECRRCHQFFFRSGEDSCWVPMEPNRRRRSYRITRADKISENFRIAMAEWCAAQGSSTLLIAWWRGWFAIAWEPSSGKLTREDIADASVLPISDWEGGEKYEEANVTAGIDVGSLFNIVITNNVLGAGGVIERRGIWAGTVVTEDQVLELLERYRVKKAGIDEGPETRIAQSIRDRAKKFGCDVWLVHFHEQPKIGKHQFALSLDYSLRRASVDRTQVFDATADQIRSGAALGRLYRKMGLCPPPDPSVGSSESKKEAEAILAKMAAPPPVGARLWPEDTPDVWGFIDQMKAPRRMTLENRIIWSKGPPDHYRLADVYDRVAYEISKKGGMFVEL